MKKIVKNFINIILIVSAVFAFVSINVFATGAKIENKKFIEDFKANFLKCAGDIQTVCEGKISSMCSMGFDLKTVVNCYNVNFDDNMSVDDLEFCLDDLYLSDEEFTSFAKIQCELKNKKTNKHIGYIEIGTPLILPVMYLVNPQEGDTLESSYKLYVKSGICKQRNANEDYKIRFKLLQSDLRDFAFCRIVVRFYEPKINKYEIDAILVDARNILVESIKTDIRSIEQEMLKLNKLTKLLVNILTMDEAASERKVLNEADKLLDQLNARYEEYYNVLQK